MRVATKLFRLEPAPRMLDLGRRDSIKERTIRVNHHEDDHRLGDREGIPKFAMSRLSSKSDLPKTYHGGVISGLDGPMPGFRKWLFFRLLCRMT